MNNDLPLWLTAADVKKHIGLTRHHLNRLVEDGAIRSKKLGPEKGSGRFFNSHDILKFMEEPCTLEM